MGCTLVMGENSTPSTGDPHFPPLGMTILPSSSSQVRIQSVSTSKQSQNNALAAQRQLLQNKPFTSAIVQDWYNLELRNSNEFIYSKLNGCFRSIQSNDLQFVKYQLAQIELMVLSMVTYYNQEKEKVQKITKSVQELCKYSITTQSPSLTQRLGDWFSGTTQEQQQL